MLPTGASAVSFTVGRVGAHCAPGRSAASSVRSGVGAGGVPRVGCGACRVDARTAAHRTACVASW